MVFFGLVLCGATMPAFAKDSPVNRVQTPRAKSLTIEAIKDIQKGRWSDAEEKAAQSKDPLASKIYFWSLLVQNEKKDWNNQHFIRLSHFIRQNPEWPKVRNMITSAEGAMPEKLSNAEVLAWYADFPPKTPYGMGRYMDALIIEGRKDEARRFLAKWWADTLTSRDQQRKIFKNYGGYLTLDAHKKRFDALLYNGYYDQARGIAGVLGQGYPELAEARIALSRGLSGGHAERIAAVPSYLQDDPGLLYERLRWRRKRDLNDGALEILLQSPDAERIYNPEDWWVERHIMIRRLLEKNDYKMAYKIAASHNQTEGFAYAQAQWVAGWLALRFEKKPTEAYERFSAMYAFVKTPVSRARAAYWAGRASEDLGQVDRAQDWYQKAAQFQTTFYGQMAGAALSLENRLPREKLPHLSSSQKSDYERNELVQAAILYKEAGQDRLSQRFIDAFLEDDGTPKAYRYMAERIADRGDYHGALRIAKKASHDELFLTKQAYPTITKHLSDINFLEWALVHALIRQESMFDDKAMSHAGARGLMQLMPATAKHVARKNGLSYASAKLTSDPHYNIYLGSRYMSELIKRYDGAYILAIAAYNAGPTRVDQWLKKFGDPRRGEIDWLDWSEIIPVYETRNYIQRVMEGVYIYRLRLSGIQVQPDYPLHVALR